MNAIGSAIKECEYYLFADDTLLSISDTSVQEYMEKLNRDLKNLSKLLKFNKLKLNVSKTKYIIMTGRWSNIENGSTNPKIRGGLGSKGLCDIPFKKNSKDPKIPPKGPFLTLYGRLKRPLQPKSPSHYGQSALPRIDGEQIARVTTMKYLSVEYLR
jgi:hypothetical protein